MADRRLPVGIQSFEDIRKNHYVYVDKTTYIWNLIQAGKVYFLSRPRRFGKSLLISTMEAYFLGEKELFEGLAIEELEDKRGEDAWTEYPVIRFSLSGGEYTREGGLAATLNQVLSKFETKYGVDPSGYDLPNRFRRLIETASERTGRQVVILVDEYDKPLLETMIVDEVQEERNRQLYKGFFSVLKDEDSYLKFVFFTGVTKFSKISVFSDLNQLEDISMTEDYSEICGITQSELLDYFGPETDALSQKLHISRATCLQKLADMYDGYHFAPESEGVYNPFSLLYAFKQRKLSRYWYATGTPTFLIHKLRESAFLPEQFANGVEADEMSLSDYQADDPDPIPLFYQTGYLTICGYDPEFQICKLKFPNNEVKYGFLNSLSKTVLGYKDAESPVTARKLVLAFQRGDIEAVMEILESLFAAIPYVEGKAPDYEQEWRNEVFLIFMLTGQHVACEVHSAVGRADCVVKTDRYIYIFEFKLDKTAEEALQQIEEKGYALPYKSDPRKTIEIGVNFSTEKRNIENWKEKG